MEDRGVWRFNLKLLLPQTLTMGNEETRKEDISAVR